MHAQIIFSLNIEEKNMHLRINSVLKGEITFLEDPPPPLSVLFLFFMLFINSKKTL